MRCQNNLETNGEDGEKGVEFNTRVSDDGLKGRWKDRWTSW